MGEFSIEKVGGELSKTFKKRPILVIGGVVLAVGAGLIMAGRANSSGGVRLTATPLEKVTAPAGDGTGGGSDLGTDPALLKLLEDISGKTEKNSVDMQSLSVAMGDLIRRQADLENYNYYRSSYPEYMNTPSSVYQESGADLQRQISLITSTPSFTTTDRNYSLSQISVMANWAESEQTALSLGTSGTSKNPVGAGAAELIVEYHPTGHVSFAPSGSSKTPTPTSAASGSSGDAYRAANDTVKLASNQKAVSSITGKTGTVEQQLSGMTQAQKLTTLKQAGLIT